MSKDNKPEVKKAPVAPVEKPKDDVPKRTPKGEAKAPEQKPINMSDVLRFLNEEMQMFTNEFKAEKGNIINYYAKSAPTDPAYSTEKLTYISSVMNSIKILAERASQRKGQK